MEQNPDHHTNEVVGGDGFDYERFAAEEAAHEAAQSKVSEESEQKTVIAKEKPATAMDSVSQLYDWVQCLVAALLFCVLLFSFFVRIIGIVGNSMLPTFQDGNSVVISKLFYTPEQGDVVVLSKKTLEKPIIKRVIAVEGQTISIDFDKHIVYVDGVALDEPYILEPITESLDFNGKVTVPENCVFVMGDNRNDSLDSRFSQIGFVDEREIMGKVLFRILPIGQFGTVD